MTTEQKNCGACGLYFENVQADKDGFHLPEFCDVAIEEELNSRLCQLCGEDIGDITKGAIVSPWGETCGTCLDQIKKINSSTEKETN